MKDVMIFAGHPRIAIKRDIGLISVTHATDRVAAIARLKERAVMMGANAIVDLRLCNTVGDPHFNIQKIYAQGKAVRV